MVPEDFEDRAQRLVNELSHVALPPAASIRRRAVKRRRVRVASFSAVLIAAGVTVAATTLGSDPRSSIRVVTTTPTTTSSSTTVDTPPFTTTAPTSPQRTESTTAPVPTTSLAGMQFPISVESDSQMRAQGNNGPSSSILQPTSCQLAGTTVTAEGTYANGGFVPNVYNRYGDVIVLYVFGGPSSGYPQGIQLGASGASESPVLGSPAPWHVSASIPPSAGEAARCVVAAQPTHDEQLAP